MLSSINGMNKTPKITRKQNRRMASIWCMPWPLWS